MSDTIDLKIDRKKGLSEPYTPPQYPTLTITSDEDHGLPDAGTATISFKKTQSSNSKDGGKMRYTCTLEVQSLSDVEAGGEAGTEETAGTQDEGADDANETETPAPAAKKGRSKAVQALLNGEAA